MGLAHGERVTSRRHVFEGSREENKQLAAVTLLTWLRDYLAELK
jgi:hypothetical protein